MIYTLSGFLDTHRGSDNIVGLSELKKYFHRFGYLPITDTNFTDNSDEQFESVVTLHQSKLGLPMIGRLESITLSQVMSPRCGVPDNDDHKFHMSKHYSLLKGRPNWNHYTPMTLNYTLLPTHKINYIKYQTFFTETQNCEHANITIGFYDIDHGDGVLAHAGVSSKVQVNAAITWAVDFNSEKSQRAFDLESWRYTKSSILDDVNGAQLLYGTNPNFKLDSFKVKNHASIFWLNRDHYISISFVIKVLFFLSLVAN
ncbi:hypothetical protein MKX01_007965 [Papaver californicum]|nr:hypothetical protein MKX01_007965 [Papaver californicum]